MDNRSLPDIVQALRREGGNAGETRMTTNCPTQSEYVLGTSADETVRLGLQHRLWSAAAHELWERARIQPGMTVLDLGCGPGYAALDLAQIVGPTGRVIAVDASATFLKNLHDLAQARGLGNIQRVLGDAHEVASILEEDERQIDVAYARWVFCFLSCPETVVEGLARLVKPGGRVAVQDYFNYERSLTLAPRREAFSRVIHAVAASWRARGGDSDVMGRLPGMFLKHGFRIEHLGVIQRIARPGDTMWHWPNSFWQSFLPRLVEMGFITPEDRAAFDRAWAEASNDPASFIQLPPVFELIVVRE
jgi:ubiquinone/menaquinone biosynthesis C-methylase UbiE